MRLAAALVAALVLAGGASAQTSSPSFVFTQDAEDVRGPLDLRRVQLTRMRDGTVQADARMHEDWDATDLEPSASGAPASVCFRLWTVRDHTAAPPDYLVCATAGDDELRGTVLRNRTNGVATRVGGARVRRLGDDGVRLVFTQKQLRSPATVRFSAETVSRGTRCPRLGCVDLAPRAGEVLTLRLRSD